MEDTVVDPLIGRHIDGRYRVIARLARGGMARVYRAMDERLEREVALKVMHSHLADNDVFRSRFQREARSAARLSHPAVVGVFDQGIDGETVYLAMELVEGKTVREYLNERRILSLESAITIIEPILDALGAAHRAGLIHRDVKPENVLMGDDGTVKVADFGLARAVTDATATSTSTVMGTVAYLSPELLSRGIADARSDIYAVGVLLHEMLTGTQPHVGETPIQVAYNHVHEDLPSASTKAPWVPKEIDALIGELAARDPDERPRDGDAALVRVLSAYQQVSDAQRKYEPTDDEVTTALVAGTPATGDAEEVSLPKDTDKQQPVSGETVALSSTQTSRFPAAAPPPPPAPGPKKPVRKSRKPKRDKPDSPKRRRKWPLLLLLLILIIGGATWWYFLQGPGSYTVVPNVIGAPATSAAKVLNEHGLESTQAEAFDDDVPIGYVIDTDPQPESSVKKDTSIEMLVSAGPEYFEIPELIGEPIDEAVQKLEEDGLKVTVAEDRAWSEKIPEDHVVKVDPEAGTEVTRRDEITLTVSAGREPIEVPLTVNMTRADAVEAIESRKLEVAVEEKYSDTLAAGHVLSQDPSSGTLYRGDKVTIIVSLGPEKIEVPNVLGKHVSDAKKELEDLGFEVKTQQMNDWWVWGERVSAQTPVGGSKIKKGEEVLLTLS